MNDSELIGGNKIRLIGEFEGLYPIHGRKWRNLLKQHNVWHKSDTGLWAWQNIRKGTTGNEALRQIVSDMKQIVHSSAKKRIAKRHGLSSPSDHRA